jgi:hypothetical protein
MGTRPTWLLRCEGCGTESAFPDEVVSEVSYAWLWALVALKRLTLDDLDRVRRMAAENIEDLRQGMRPPRWIGTP